MHPADRHRLADPSRAVRAAARVLEAAARPEAHYEQPDDVRDLLAGEALEVAGLALHVQHAPGHTEGSAVLVLDGVPDVLGAPLWVAVPPRATVSTLLSGDVLFAGSVGRTDLPGGPRGDGAHPARRRRPDARRPPRPRARAGQHGRARARDQPVPAPLRLETPVARPTPLSGFPELLPQARLVEQHVLDVLREVFELHGFSSIETRAVEPLSVLLRKGEIDKEVYGVRRLQADADAADGGSGDDLALHFDLTVPFARYVTENAGHLQFPFRRNQVQKVWRGERPQEGRYREFTQADIDVVDRGTLAVHHDADMARVMARPWPACRCRA